MIGLLESMSSTGAARDLKGSRVRIVADTRTNRIVLKGDTATRKRIRQMIEMLDVPTADRLGGLKVFRLKYASAKNLAEILQGLVTGQAVASSSNSNTSSSSNNNNAMNYSSGSSSNNSSGGSSSIATPSINLGAGSNSNNQNSITSFNAIGVSNAFVNLSPTAIAVLAFNTNRKICNRLFIGERKERGNIYRIAKLRIFLIKR